MLDSLICFPEVIPSTGNNRYVSCILIPGLIGPHIPVHLTEGCNEFA